jgi:Putative beta-barrel porin-2, OmpL-like. bbp2
MEFPSLKRANASLFASMKKFILIKIVIVGIFLSCFCSISCFASVLLDSVPNPVTPLNVSGSLDGYYRYGFNKTGSATSFTGSHNTFALGWANIILSKDGAKTGFLVDLAVGQRANEFNYFYSSSSTSSSNFQPLSIIKQAYLYWKPSKDIKLSLGSFSSHIGYEVPEATTNLNYSMSYLFSSGPFYHTGLKMDYAIDSAWSIMAGLFNDTDTKYTNGNGLHLAGQLSYQKGNIKCFLNYLYGSETGTSSNDSLALFGNQVDLVVNYQASKKWILGLNATTKSIGSPSLAKNIGWGGVAIYANYASSKDITWAFRGEYFGDKDGYNLGNEDKELGTSVTAFTVSANIKSESITFIPEFRFDVAGKNIFTDSKGVVKSSEGSFLLAAVYKF